MTDILRNITQVYGREFKASLNGRELIIHIIFPHVKEV
jgi:hypothetical protein